MVGQNYMFSALGTYNNSSGNFEGIGGFWSGFGLVHWTSFTSANAVSSETNPYGGYVHIKFVGTGTTTTAYFSFDTNLPITDSKVVWAQVTTYISNPTHICFSLDYNNNSGQASLPLNIVCPYLLLTQP